MSSHFYEVALFGEFFSRDLKAILNRITLHSESSQTVHTREIVFEPLDAQHQREVGSDPILLRARKELSETDSPWVLYSYLKPEPARVHPEATVRPWSTCQVVGDALSFAAALGYVYVSPTSLSFKLEGQEQAAISNLQARLCISTRNACHIDVSTGTGMHFIVVSSSVLVRIQTFTKVDPKTQQPIPAHTDTLWEVEVKNASPIRNTQETPLSQVVNAVLEVQLFMKGLLDLRRQDI